MRGEKSTWCGAVVHEIHHLDDQIQVDEFLIVFRVEIGEDVAVVSRWWIRAGCGVLRRRPSGLLGDVRVEHFSVGHEQFRHFRTREFVGQVVRGRSIHLVIRQRCQSSTSVMNVKNGENDVN